MSDFQGVVIIILLIFIAVMVFVLADLVDHYLQKIIKLLEDIKGEHEVSRTRVIEEQEAG